MFKKILTILLCFALSFSALVGCRLFKLDENRDFAEPVAVIQSRSLPIKVRQENGSYKDSVFTSKERTVSKYQLYNAFQQFGPIYQRQFGMTVEEAYDKLLDQLVERELLLTEIERLIASNEIRFRQSELNKVWKEVYDKIDEAVYEYETEIAKEYGEEPYTRNEGEDIKPQWPVFQYPQVKDEKEDKDDYPIENNIIMDEEVWRPEGSRGPIFDYDIIENGTDAQKQAYFKTDEYRAAALKTEALKRFLQNIKENLDVKTLSAEDAAKFQEDLKVIDQYKDAKPYEYAKLYGKLQEFWFIKYLYYNSAYDSMLFAKLEEYVESGVSVTEEEVASYYNKKLAEQKASFNADINNYISALKDGDEVILYHPKDVKWFYVKHILIPFSDQQKAEIEQFKKTGQTKEAVEEYRKRVSNNITSYKHVNGYNFGSPKTLAQIESEIYAELSTAGNNEISLKRKFDQLIYAYNTDPGIFDSLYGYGLQYTESSGTSGYMIEFEEACFKLYKQGKIGAVEKAITDDGVHYIMLYSIVKPGTKELGDYTTEFRDGFYDAKYEDVLRNELLENKKKEAYNNYQSRTLKQLKREWKPYISMYENRYSRLIKLAKGQ
ncbi:MAG TPA: hypothetical protein VIL23_02095 [Clostridia bacterium]